MLRHVAKHSKQRKTTKVILFRLICIDLTSERSKQRKTTKVIKLRCNASIWRQNDQNNAKLQKWSNYNELHRFDVKTIKNRKTTKVIKLSMHCIDLMSKRSQNYKSNQIPINLHRFDVKTIKNVELRRKSIQNNAKLQNWSNYNELHRFDVKTIKLQTQSNYDEFASIWHQNYKKCWGRRKTFKTKRKTTKVIN